MQSEYEIKGFLQKAFALRGGDEVEILRRREENRKDEYVLAYRLQLTNGAVVDLGTASELIKFSKVQAAFAESYGHVIPSKESKNWDQTAQLLFDLFAAMKDDFRQKEALPVPADGYQAGDEVRVLCAGHGGYVGYVRDVFGDEPHVVSVATTPIEEPGETLKECDPDDLELLDRPWAIGEEKPKEVQLEFVADDDPAPHTPKNMGSLDGKPEA